MRSLLFLARTMGKERKKTLENALVALAFKTE
jgi:hypothetical protein